MIDPLSQIARETVEKIAEHIHYRSGYFDAGPRFHDYAEPLIEVALHAVANQERTKVLHAFAAALKQRRQKPYTPDEAYAHVSVDDIDTLLREMKREP